MKTIVLVALLAAAGCSKKTSDCEAAIGKGMDNFASEIKTTAPDPKMQEMRMGVITKLRGALTQRCNEDKWPAEVVACFNTVHGMKDMQGCQVKLNDAQRAKLMNEIREVMMSTMGARMPAGLAGHPATLTGSSAAPEGTGGAGAAPAGTGMAPAGTGAAPAGTGAAPAGTGAAPAGTGAAPAGTGAAPAGTGAAPASGW